MLEKDSQIFCRLSNTEKYKTKQNFFKFICISPFTFLLLLKIEYLAETGEERPKTDI